MAVVDGDGDADPDPPLGATEAPGAAVVGGTAVTAWPVAIDAA